MAWFAVVMKFSTKPSIQTLCMSFLVLNTVSECHYPNSLSMIYLLKIALELGLSKNSFDFLGVGRSCGEMVSYIQ